MCGIIAAFGPHPHENVWKQYEKQSNRGSEGFGFIALRDGRIVDFARRITESGIKLAMKKVRADAILFHHRLPTSTVNIPEANHPIPIEHESWKHRYYILHNGVITNASSHQYTIARAGYRYKTEVRPVSYWRAANGNVYSVQGSAEVNDSEILGYYIAEMFEGQRDDIPLYGAIACIVVQEDAKGHCKVFALRNEGNPLKAMRIDKGLLIASEADGYMIDSGELWEVQKTALRLRGPVECGLSYPKTVTGYYTGGPVESEKEERAIEEAAIADVERRLQKELEEAESELQIWEAALESCQMAERQAVLAEIKIVEKKVEKLTQELESLYGYSYGAENPAESRAAILG